MMMDSLRTDNNLGSSGSSSHILESDFWHGVKVDLPGALLPLTSEGSAPVYKMPVM